MIKSLFNTPPLLSILLFSIILFSCASLKKKNNPELKIPETSETKPKKSDIKPFHEVITNDASTDQGLFDVHSLEDKFYYEIPDSLLGLEMLMVTRVSKTANGLGFGGGKQNEQVLRWQRKNNNILLREVSYKATAADSLPISEAVLNSNFEPIMFSFPILALGNDSTSVVIDVTPLFSKDIKALGLPKSRRKKFQISSIQSNKSYIESIKSYPKNIESRHVKTYSAGSPPSNSSAESISIEISNSMILLPKIPMKRRYFDKRVGWFTSKTIDYGLDEQKSKTLTYINRWRLEVKDEDIEKFKNGELVEPKKPIMYYIDRATPKKWRKYIKQGIEDWQVAFEEAGFKNAIIAKAPPTKEEDPDWSPEDVRYSVVRYLASPIPNANGPHVSDPRTGEILESDINWYHNVMSLLRGWFFVQTGAINPEAQSPQFRDEIMGRLIRFVSSHEVGHTLGLPHNMGSSSAYPVEKLRDSIFTQIYGTTPSIMDYARFNYVAQPEDKGVALMPKIGQYDKYSIRWGYRPILDKTAREEKNILNKWITEKAGNPIYRFGRQQFSEIIDPSSQTEDLGDDAMLASEYGIKNLKRIVPNLIKWTTTPGEDYSDLKEMYKHVISQFNRYIGHVVNNIGGVYEDYKTSDQEGLVYTPVTKSHQKRAMVFLQNHLFKTPKWLIDKSILDRIEHSGSLDKISNIQLKGLNSLLDVRRMKRMIEAETHFPKEAYTLTEMMSDLRNSIWVELNNRNPIDPYKRNLQRAYIEILENLLNSDNKKDPILSSKKKKIYSKGIGQTDIKAIIKYELKTLESQLQKYPTKDRMSRIHITDILDSINKVLNPVIK